MGTENIEQEISNLNNQKNLEKEKLKKLELKYQQKKTRLSLEKEKEKKKLKHLKNQEDFFKK